MGVTHLAAICRTLLKLGKPADTPAAVVEWGTTALQRTEVATLATIADVARQASVHPPALLVVGSVVALRDQLAWFESLPLFGQRIVVTRPRDDGNRAAALLESLGAEVLLAPTVEVRPISAPASLDAAIDGLASYDWLVFTSANGVRFFMERLADQGRDLRVLGHLEAGGDRVGNGGGPGQLSSERGSRSRNVSLRGAGGRTATACARAENSAGPRRSGAHDSQG